MVLIKYLLLRLSIRGHVLWTDEYLRRLVHLTIVQHMGLLQLQQGLRLTDHLRCLVHLATAQRTGLLQLQCHNVCHS
jgi:hypothetical protein